jgi:hypothetical protein
MIRVVPICLDFQRSGVPADDPLFANAGVGSALAAIGCAKASGEKPCGSPAPAMPHQPRAMLAASATPGTPQRALPAARITEP